MIPEDAENALPARPQRAKGRGVRGWYVEALSDARTKLAAFFNILLEFGDRIDAQLKPWRHSLLAVSLFVFPIPHSE